MTIKKNSKELVESLVKGVIEEASLLESVRPGVKFKVGGKEMDFGGADHQRVLKGMLHGLQALRDCYNMGSANRHVYSSACSKIARLLKRLAPPQA